MMVKREQLGLRCIEGYKPLLALIRNHLHMQSHNLRRNVIDLSSVIGLLFVCGWLGVFVSHLEQ